MITRPTRWRAPTGTHAPVPQHAALRPACWLLGGSARWRAAPVADDGQRSHQLRSVVWNLPPAWKTRVGPSNQGVASSKRVSHTGLDGAERRPQVPHESPSSINIRRFFGGRSHVRQGLDRELARRWLRPTDSMCLCSLPSRRLAALGPRYAGLAALTAAPRTLGLALVGRSPISNLVHDVAGVRYRATAVDHQGLGLTKVRNTSRAT